MVPSVEAAAVPGGMWLGCSSSVAAATDPRSMDQAATCGVAIWGEAGRAVGRAAAERLATVAVCCLAASAKAANIIVGATASCGLGDTRP